MAAQVASAWKVIPMLKCRSTQASARFYKEELSFKIGDEAVLSGDQIDAYPASVFIGKKAAVNIYLFNAKDSNMVVGEVLIALGTDELDEYYQVLQKRARVNIVEPIKDQPWGYRQFSIEDIDGNKLTFFKFLEGGNPGSE